MKAITIAGRTGRDCEVQSYEGREFITFSVAVDTYDRKTKQKGVMFFDCSYNRTGLAQWMKKGTPVCVSGEFVAEEYNGKTYLKVRANDITLLGSAPKEEMNVPQAAARIAEQERSRYENKEAIEVDYSRDATPPPQHENTTSQDMDDEIPF
ncbi:single stranded DNA-binding protein [uncultured Mediterranean phage uvMED]|nr:single stranded DNA-binding protein [uncultured Mediterranean phage uvMED]BAR19678.1 single-stranded DNA-binding protein (TIGR00621) [uncultured Mediterranean phage uvMED]